MTLKSEAAWRCVSQELCCSENRFNLFSQAGSGWEKCKEALFFRLHALLRLRRPLLHPFIALSFPRLKALLISIASLLFCIPPLIFPPESSHHPSLSLSHSLQLLPVISLSLSLFSTFLSSVSSSVWTLLCICFSISVSIRSFLPPSLQITSISIFLFPPASLPTFGCTYDRTRWNNIYGIRVERHVLIYETIMKYEWRMTCSFTCCLSFTTCVAASSNFPTLEGWRWFGAELIFDFCL